ncbi:C2H2 finger domain protein [Cenococcum geophilum]
MPMVVRISLTALKSTSINVEDLALVLKTNLVIIRKRYILGFCTTSRPKALLNLCYRHIKVTLIRDLEGGPYKIVLKFIFKFTKEYLSIKEATTFTPPNLTSVEQLSKLYIKPRRNKLPLPLRLDLDNIPIFRLRYGAGKAFNKNGNISNALRNLIMQHANARIFLKYYLPRRVGVDT